MPSIPVGRRASYQVFIDWDNDGWIDLGNFELSTDDWGAVSGSPTVDTTAVRSHLGSQSLLVTWPTATAPSVGRTLTNLTSGRTYTFSAWVYVPTASPSVQLAVGASTSSTMATKDGWRFVEMTFTASSATATFTVVAPGSVSAGTTCYIDQAMLLGPGEEVTDHLLAVRGSIDIEYGRDLARSMADIRPGECAFELNNIDHRYTPTNASSPLAGFLEPGKPILIRATYNGKAYDLFRGFLEDYELLPAKDQRSVRFSAVDLLTRLADTKVSTELFPSLQTGQAMHKVLDAAGWPTERRDIDAGATTCRWFWEEGRGAWEALQDLMQAEGPPSYCSIDASGNFIFRDRHHRLTSTASTTSQQTFRSDGLEPVFSAPMTYDIGWKDIINTFEVDVEEREPEAEDESGYLTRVFGTTDRYVLRAGETRIISVKSEEPFYAAVDPVDRADLDDDNPRIWDYETISGTVTVTLSRSSGQSCDIIVTAVTDAVVQNMGLRATTVPVARTYKIKVEDLTSVEKHGVKSYGETSLPWAGRWDAEAIGNVVVGLRSTRLPIVTFTVKNANQTRTTAQLTRNLSDRITVVDQETELNDQFYIEQIRHTISDAGHRHDTQFGCERVISDIATVFTFGVVGKGFGSGAFGGASQLSSTSIFILDQDQLDQEYLGY